ncbi:hypothetical protein DM02DRAFT_54175 [Periconia macrospinosa]|uniref:Uncharacterized protein n=1 Tax=Periconia macrospinosa TaxID=97972 RepID=A0A2V1E5W9_9PLEO|nr:hypothetical protein DM02DRAFT_54175 [Periconia macrospinosa]
MHPGSQGNIYSKTILRSLGSSSPHTGSFRTPYIGTTPDPAADGVMALHMGPSSYTHILAPTSSARPYWQTLSNVSELESFHNRAEEWFVLRPMEALSQSDAKGTRNARQSSLAIRRCLICNALIVQAHSHTHGCRRITTHWHVLPRMYCVPLPIPDSPSTLSSADAPRTTQRLQTFARSYLGTFCT